MIFLLWNLRIDETKHRIQFSYTITLILFAPLDDLKLTPFRLKLSISPSWVWTLYFRTFIPVLRHHKTNKMSVRPAKTPISLGIRPVWSESLLSAWRKLGSLGTHWAHSEDSDQTGRMPWLIWVYAGRTLILLVLWCRGSIIFVLLLLIYKFIFRTFISHS